MSYETPVRSAAPAAELDEAALRRQLTEYATRLKNRGLTSATGGNMSYRTGEDMLISPSGFCLDEVGEADWVRVNLETAQPYPDQLKPSSETLMHRNVYLLRPDTNAVIHSHPPHVIALSLLRIAIRPIGSEAPFLLGKQVPIVPYTIPTSPLLAESIKPYVPEHSVMVLENHGLLTMGKDNREAFNRTELSEEIAKIMYVAISLGRGEPNWPTEKMVDEYLDWIYYRKLPEN
jgi:L-fuculose-phosphate aldolase